MTSNLSNLLERFQLPLFFVMSLASWVIWIPQAAVALGIRESAIPLDSPANALTVWGPGVAAIVVTLLTVGRGGVRRLFRPIRRWRVGIQWYIFVLLFPVGKWLVAYVLDVLLGQSYELGVSPILSVFGPEQAIMLPIAVVFAFPNTLGEELGWRGFALPKLQAKSSALVSSVIIGLFWGLWHVPTWVAQGVSDLSTLPLFAEVVSMVPVAILFTWVYNSTKGSLLLVWLFHASMAITGYFVPLLPTVTEKILLWLVAILVVVLARSTRFHRQSTWPAE
jgi:membrane protease YdiL (CAAX protease family)